MTVSGEEGDSVFLRGWDDYERFSLQLTASHTSGLGHAAFRTRSAKALDRRLAALRAEGCEIERIERNFGHGPSFPLPRPGRACVRTLLGDGVVRPAARTAAGAEKPGRTLPCARGECAPDRSLQLPRRRCARLPRVLPANPWLPLHRADRARLRRGGGHVADRHQQILRLRLHQGSARRARALPSPDLRPRQPGGHPAGGRHLPRKPGCSSRPGRTSTPCSRPSSSTSTNRAATASRWRTPARD